MSLKTIIIAALFTATASTAFAQQTQQQQQPQNPLRPTQPSAPAAPTAPAQPAAPRAAQPATPAPAAAQPAQRAAPANQNQIVNLNTATKDQLDSLPQIGAARAEAIIKGRPYRDWADFTSKNIIPTNAENAIKDRVRFR